MFNIKLDRIININGQPSLITNLSPKKLFAHCCSTAVTDHKGAGNVSASKVAIVNVWQWH